MVPYTFAQFANVDIAKTYIIEDEQVVSGDIISFDKTLQEFNLSNRDEDEDVFGITSDDPLLVLVTEEDGIPVVRTGEAMVNVTSINGPIIAGDFITSSLVPGKGRKADDSDSYIIGIALDPFLGEFTATSTTEEVVSGGTIRVLLRIGSKASVIQEFSDSPAEQNTGVTEATVLNIVQYILAAFIAVGSIYVAFKNFGPNIKDGIVSVGRNPLAKSSIQSMVILNIILIILISAGGLFVSLAILLLPI